MAELAYIPKLYTGDTEPFVFISYSHKDATAVYKDLSVLEQRHVRFWYDYGIPPGPEWDKVVEGIISKPNCAGAIFYFSHTSLASEAVQKEMRFWQAHIEQAQFSYASCFAVLLDTDDFATLFGEAMQADPMRFLDAAGAVTRLFTSKSLYIKHPRVAGAPVGAAYYDALIKGVDVFGAREIGAVHGSYRPTPDHTLGGMTLYPVPDTAEPTRLLPDVLAGARVVKIGDRAFAGDEILYRVEIPWGVRVIGERAFAGCRNLTEVILPDTIEEIGECAFGDCTALGELALPSSLVRIHSHAFAGCTALSAIHLPTGVTQIPSGCFEGCVSLAEMNLSPDTTEIGAEAFLGCTALGAITLPDALVRVGREAFAGSGLSSLVVPCAPRELNERAFAGCVKLRDVTLAAPREVIGRELFAGCTALRHVTLPADTKELRDGAFAGCTSLVEMTLPDGLETLGDGVFAGCTALQAVTLPRGLSGIGRRCFAGCTALATLALPATLSRIGAMAFMLCRALHLSLDGGSTGFTLADGMLRTADGTELVTVDAGADPCLVIPEGTSVLRPGALAGCTATNVTLPDSLREIGQYVFFGMPHLACLTIGDGVEKIANGNFSACTCLSQVTLPATCKRFGGNLFRDLPMLSAVQYPADEPRELGLCCFANCPALQKILTPHPTALATKRGWEEVAACIKEEKHG